MKIIQRYILLEFLVPLFYCLAGFLAIYVLFDLFGSFSRMADSGVSFADAVLYFCGYLAPYLHYLAPAALLLATLYTMWTMCRHSEITAMRASGISFIAIASPLLSVAIVLATLVCLVNETFVPRYAQWANQLKAAKFSVAHLKHSDNIVYRNAAGARTWNIDRLLTRDGTSLSHVRLTFDRPGGGRLRTVTAERADYLDGEWWFSGTCVQHYAPNGTEVASPEPAADALSFRAFPRLDERPSDFRLQNRPWKFNSVSDRFRYLQTHPELSPERRDEYLYDTWAQILSPFACIVITLFAIPAGIATGRQSVMKGVLGALALFFSFYGVSIGCMVLAKNNHFPPVLSSLFPHAVFLALGIRAFLKQR